MAYQTGVVSSASDLVSLIKTFASLNGWSLNGDVISRGESFIRIVVASSNEIRIDAARNGNFSGLDLCPRYSKILNNPWPSMATYHIVAFQNPDTVWCTINFDTVKHQHIGFGCIEKYGSWSGGTWFHAQHTKDSTGQVYCRLDGGGTLLNYTTPLVNECGLFWSPSMRDSWTAGYRDHAASNLLCEVRGNIWEPPYGVANIAIHCPTILSPIHKRNPNAFNNQTVLTPFQLFIPSADGYYTSIGHVGHLRFVKLTNYNPGDVIEIGPDRWKLFPWGTMDTLNPNGGYDYNARIFTTGVLGVAVRYDGP